MSFAIGIDLGTSTSEICVFRNHDAQVIPDPFNPGRSPIVPSIVAISRNGELFVGHPARSFVDMPDSGIREVKRLMGSGQTVQLRGRSYRPEDISAMILRKLKDNAQEALGAAVREVVLSVPANFPDPARQATLAAGEIAGLKVTRLIDEPTAAALAYGVKHLDAEERLVVFDFGGGTLDITALEMGDGVMEARSSFGDTQLGGKDFDQALIDVVLRKFAAEHPDATPSAAGLRMLKQHAEEAKIALSGQQSAMVLMPNFSQGTPSVDLEVTVSREEFEREVAPLLDRARACVRQALGAKQIRPSTIDRVILVGGTTYIPCVRQLVAEMFNVEPRTDLVNPDLAVATGAAIQAGIAGGLADSRNGLIFIPVSPFGLGIDVLNQDSTRLLYSPLIPPNTTIPYSVRKQYRLTRVDQKEVEIELYQDHKGTANLIEDAAETGIKTRITDIPPSVDGTPHGLEVDFSYDLNGLAILEARIPATGQSVVLKYDKSSKRTSREHIDAAKSDLEDLWNKNPHAARYNGLIKRGEQVAAASESARAQVEPLAQSLRDAVARDDLAAAARAAEALTDLLFDLDAA